MGDPAATSARHVVGVLRNRAVLAMGVASLATGFAQFAAVVALGDVAAAFGEAAPASVSSAGSASLAGLPLAGSADRLGRRRTLLAFLGAGLALTAAAATSQGFWWFVAAFALARPGLSAVNAIAGVIAAEETVTGARSAAMAVVTVGYGVGSGTVAVVRAFFSDALGFRGLFALALVALVVVVPLLARTVGETGRFAAARATLPDVATVAAPPVLGPLAVGLRGRLGVMATTTFAVAFAAGPATGLLFVYGENVLAIDPAVVGGAVAVAAPLGMVGLLAGRWAADRLGRRLAAAAAQVAIAVAVAVTYGGGPAALIGGYLAVLLAQSAYAPPGGALAAELFPTRVRATAAGWLTASGVLGAVGGLVAFGVVADAADSTGVAAAAVAVPAAVTSLLFALVPETRDRELDDDAR